MSQAAFLAAFFILLSVNKRFQAGRVIQGSPMTWGAFRRINESDLKALDKFLRTLQPVHSQTPAGVQDGDPK